MPVITYKVIPDLDKSTITSSKNYRIFSAGEPIPGTIKIIGFDEDLSLGSALSQNINRKFRYSTDRGNWSLWYTLDPSDLGEIEALDFENSSVFFEIKYEYDDLSYAQLAEPITVHSVKLRVQSSYSGSDLLTPSVKCSPERCPAVVAENEAFFQPYEVGSAIGISKELSFQTNRLFGHEVVYFKTEPDRDSGDFIFKEWTLFKTTARKCIKVVVPNNVFPDNKPSFTEFGVDFEIPFEIHVDHTYFQMMFGANSQPRKRDYLYFPLLNRMYEIQGSYLFRGFMMEPTYWKIQLTKFHPNVDMLMQKEDRTFLDNIIMTSDELFGDVAKEQTDDALAKQQYSTISTKFDETRRSLHPDINNRILDITYNYAPLIEYYYDLGSIRSKIETHKVSSSNSKADQYLTVNQPFDIYAYEDSSIYKNWETNLLRTGDTLVLNDGSLVSVKFSGPKPSYSHLGKYVVAEGYKTLGFLPKERRSLSERVAGEFQFKQSEHAIIYKSVASTEKTPNMTFSALVKFNRGAQAVTIFSGFDNLSNAGIIISCTIQDVSGLANITFHININGETHSFQVGELQFDSWYSIIVPVSAQYGQLELSLYSFKKDQANVKNYNGLVKVFNKSKAVGKFEFITTQNWSIPAANYSICNIRLFNTMVQEEDHEFIISQLFVRDESTLELIDNARPRLNVPFIAINR